MPAEADAPANPAPGGCARACVLVVDDAPSQRGLAAALIAKAGYRVLLAESGAEAVSRAAAGGIDLILMDLQMPGLNGLAATRLIRAMPPPASDVPIVALTADATPADRKRCLATGMTDFLAKPIDRSVLLRTLAAGLAADRPTGRNAA